MTKVSNEEQSNNANVLLAVVYSPLTNQNNPFVYNGQRFNRNELDKIGLSNQCKIAIINYR